MSCFRLWWLSQFGICDNKDIRRAASPDIHYLTPEGIIKRAERDVFHKCHLQMSCGRMSTSKSWQWNIFRNCKLGKTFIVRATLRVLSQKGSEKMFREYWSKQISIQNSNEYWSRFNSKLVWVESKNSQNQLSNYSTSIMEYRLRTSSMPAPCSQLLNGSGWACISALLFLCFAFIKSKKKYLTLKKTFCKTLLKWYYR